MIPVLDLAAAVERRDDHTTASACSKYGNCPVDVRGGIGPCSDPCRTMDTVLVLPDTEVPYGATCRLVRGGEVDHPHGVSCPDSGSGDPLRSVRIGAITNGYEDRRSVHPTQDTQRPDGFG